MGIIKEDDVVNTGRIITEENTLSTSDPSFYQKWIKPIAQPVTEALGLVGGAIAGAPAGPLGAVAGAGLGFAGAKQAYRTAEELAGVSKPAPLSQQLLRTGKEVITGAEYEMGGQIAGKAISAGVEGVKKAGRVVGKKLGFPQVTEKGIKKEALKRFTELKTKAETSAQVQENIKVAKELEEKIPGLKLSYGQITNDADAISLERGLARGGGATMSQQQRAVANKVLEDYYASKVVAGTKTGSLPQRLDKALGKEGQAEFLESRGLTEEQIVKQQAKDAVTAPLNNAKALEKQGNIDLANKAKEEAFENVEKMLVADGETTEKVLSEELGKEVKSITGKAEDFIGALSKEKAGLEATAKQTQQTVDTEVSRLSRHIDEQSMGKKVYGILSKGQQIAKTRATALYNKIPDVKVKTDTLNKSLDNVLNDYDPIVESSKNIPSKLINGLKKITDNGTKPIGFQQLRKLRSNVLSEIRTAQGSATPNDQYIRRLRMVQEGIENSIDSLSGELGQAGELYRKASSFYKEYASQFKQGTVADVLAKGTRGEETRIGLANIASKFDRLDGIDDFVRAVGDKNIAKDTMRDYYQFDFLNKTRTPEGEITTNRAMQWLYRNSGKLKKLGLFDEFKDVATKRYSLQVAEKNLDVFNKSVANKILEADVDDFVRTAFRGSKNYGATAQELLNKVKGNKAAEQGLKKAFAENLMKETETTAPEFFQAIGAETPAEIEFAKSIAKLTNNLKKYSSAIRVMYKDEPQKVKAIHDVWNAYQTLARTTKSPLGGGSDTAENMFNILVGAGGARAGRFYLIKSIRDAFSKFSERHINEYMRRIMFNPEYAASLVAFKKGVTPEKINNLNRLMTLITYEIRESKESNPENED